MTAPYVPQKQSILDRLAARLFPATQMLDPQAAQNVGRQGLLNIGTNLLQAGGPSAQQQGTLANIGGAIGGVDIPGLTQQALKLQAYRQQQQAQQAATAVVSRHPAKPGETGEERFGRFSDILTELAGIPGTEHLIGPLSNVMNALKPEGRQRNRYVFKELNEGGSPVIYRINEDDPTDRIRIGAGMPQAGTAGVQAQETKGAAGNALAALDQMDALLRDDPNADVLPTMTAIARGAGRLPVVGSALSGLTEPAAQRAMTPSQQKFQQAADQFLHNYASVLPRGGRSIAILQNLRASFTPGPGQTDADVRRNFAKARTHLRHTLEDLRAGKITPEQLPSTEDAIVVPESAAAPAAPPSAAPATPGYNPKFWRRP